MVHVRVQELHFQWISDIYYYSGREAPTLKMGFFFLGSTSGLYLIGWHAANMSSMSSDEECNVKCALLAQLGSMDCLLERSYHIHTPAAVHPLIFIEHFGLGRFPTAKPSPRVVGQCYSVRSSQ